MIGHRALDHSDRDPQPLIIGINSEIYAIVVAGLIENVNELGSNFSRRGNFWWCQCGINSVEWSQRCERETISRRIEGVYWRIKGSASILLLKKDGMFGSPGSLGEPPGHRRKEWRICHATETCSFFKFGFRIKKIPHRVRSFMLENRVEDGPGKKMNQSLPSCGF